MLSKLEHHVYLQAREGGIDTSQQGHAAVCQWWHITVHKEQCCLDKTRTSLSIFALDSANIIQLWSCCSETDDDKSSLLATAPADPAAAPTHIAYCFDTNGWRYHIGTVKDLKDNIQQGIIFYAWDCFIDSCQYYSKVFLLSFINCQHQEIKVNVYCKPLWINSTFNVMLPAQAII